MGEYSPKLQIRPVRPQGHIPIRTYRDLARKAGPRFRETDALIGTNRRISVWAAVKHDVLGGRPSFVNLKPTQKSERVNSPLLRYLGWATFGVMTAAVVRRIGPEQE